jgi:hypothetical protein
MTNDSWKFVPPPKIKKKKSLTRSQSVLYSNNSNNNKKSQNQIDFDKSKKSQRNRCWPLRWKDISQRGLYIISYLPSIAHIYTYCIYKQFTIYSYLPFLFFLFCKKKIQHQIKWYISSFSFFFFFLAGWGYRLSLLGVFCRCVIGFFSPRRI